MPAELTIGSTLVDNARRFASLPAYVEDDRIRTHGELLVRATEIAASLSSLGVRQQDRIAVLSRNTIEFGEVLAAAHVSGFVAATVNFRLSASEIVALLRDCAPRALFFEQEYLPLVQSIKASIPDIDILVCFGEGDTSVIGYGDFRSRATGAKLPHSATADDVASLIYTSGTTGTPKGCILGQRELRRVGLTMNNEMRAGSSDRVLMVMPMFHIGGMAIAMGVHARGGTVVLRSQFDPDESLHTIEHERISILHVAPMMLRALVDAVPANSTALAGVRTVVYSAAPMTPTTLSRALAHMPNAGFLNLYGQTEVIVSGLPRELHQSSSPREIERLRTVGFPFQDTEVRIVDADGRDAETGAPGEITVRSPMSFRGYWNNSIATAQTVRRGWCSTGDIGSIDGEGLLRLIDRKKDIIISGGENISSIEVEDAVLTHPSVSECAVVAQDDEKWGEIVCAVVVLGDTFETVDRDTIRNHVGSRIARYKAPRSLVIVNELPKLPTGKIDKKRLRTQLGSEPARGKARLE